MVWIWQFNVSKRSGALIMKDIRPNSTIDVRDLISPVSLLKVENKLAEMAPGQIVEVLCTDEDTRSDLSDIIRNSNHRCITVEKIADYFKLLIEKNRLDP